jgi:hypothetical protein
MKLKHRHVWDINPKLYPKGNKSSEYASELSKLISTTSWINEKIQLSFNLCSFYISHITKKRGYTPDPDKVFEEIKEFVYQYENFCHRVYSFREKLLKYINNTFDLGIDDKQVNATIISTHKKVIKNKLNKIVNRFNDNRNILTVLVNDRNISTHRLNTEDNYLRPSDKSYKKGDTRQFEFWCESWVKKIKGKADNAMKGTRELCNVNHQLTDQTLIYLKK